MYKNEFILFMLSSFLYLGASAQPVAADTLQKQFNQYLSSHLHEKLFVHTDKSFYLAGEIIWFKVYALEGNTHVPLTVSKVSYVEIITKDNKSLAQAKIAMSDGNGNGSFHLPFSVNTGSYTLRAYTSWMKNFSPDDYFEKPVTIVNTLKRPDWQAVNDSAAYNVQFFPEGGNLVSGIQSTVAFKGVNQYGRGIGFSGFLLNQVNDTVARFQPFKFGAGRFTFIPAAGNTYKAMIRVEGNKLLTCNLPHVYEQGYVMHVQSLDNNRLSVAVSTNAHASTPFVYLVAYAGQSVTAVQAKEISGGKAAFVLDKNVLAEGISHFIVLDDNRQPVCERLYFKRPGKQLPIALKTDQAAYHTRMKVQLSIDTHQQPADLSLSVFLMDSLQGTEQNNIYTYLWLGSEIKGPVESPEYYFTGTGAAAEEATDNLMLTQGWRRFTWENTLQHPVPAFRYLPEYEGQIINGQIVDRASNAPVKGTLVYLSAPGEKFHIGSAVSNDSGAVQFVLNNFYGTSGLILQTDNEKDSSYSISLSNPFSEIFGSAVYPPLALPEKWNAQLLQRSIGAQAQNAYLQNEQQRFFLPAGMDTLPFYGKPDKQYLLDDYTRFPTMEEVMREFVTEVHVRRQQEQYYYDVSNALYKVFFKTGPLVLLNGIPVWNINKIIAFNPLQVKKLDVVTHKYFLDGQVYNGIVSYTTYNGNITGFDINPGAIELEYEGLQLNREFYSPAYESPQQQSRRLPDFRNVLYWSPDIHTDAQGKKQVEFYTSDVPGEYIAMVQGITADGLAGSTTVNISVRK